MTHKLLIYTRYTCAQCAPHFYAMDVYAFVCMSFAVHCAISIRIVQACYTGMWVITSRIKLIVNHSKSMIKFVWKKLISSPFFISRLARISTMILSNNTSHCFVPDLMVEVFTSRRMDTLVSMRRKWKFLHKKFVSNVLVFP